jgi:predicted NodU family carbamoyl transferase
MNILGINISHNCSIAFYKNKIITNLYEEERFNNIKFFKTIVDDSFLICLDEKLNFKPDVVCYSSFGRTQNKDFKIIKNIQKQLNHPKYYFSIQDHHIHHACCGYYFSKYDEAMAIVVDGGGAPDKNNIGYQEIESIFYINKKNVITKFKSMTNRRNCLTDISDLLHYSNYAVTNFVNGVEYFYSSLALGGYLFSKIATQVGLPDESGKVMGLASYSKTDKNFNLDKNKINLCQEAQDTSFERTCFLIEKAFKYKNIKNFILSGGYFLNCSNNFKYVKKYPNFNFFVDPVPNDAGAAIGVCIYYENYL